MIISNNKINNESVNKAQNHRYQNVTKQYFAHRKRERIKSKLHKTIQNKVTKYEKEIVIIILSFNGTV